MESFEINIQNSLVDGELLVLLTQLDKTMETLANLDEEKRETLYVQLEEIISQFRSLHSIENQITGTIPFELVELIDQGTSPTDYAKKIVEQCKLSAKRVEKKQKWMQHLKDSLDLLIPLNFSDFSEQNTE